MNALKQKICDEGLVRSGNVLVVDSFLNHQLDIELLEQMGQEFCRRFADRKVNKVFTMETSGIAVAYSVARNLGVPLVFAKKADSVKIDGEVWQAEVPGMTSGSMGQVMVSKKFLCAGDKVLILDDIMANGCAMQALISLVEDADAAVEGCGVVIEKAFQEGGHRIRNLGYRLEALAVIEHMDPAAGTVTFRD